MDLPLPARRRSAAWIGALLLVLLLGIWYAYVNQKPPPERMWQPGPYDPPVHYAYLPEATGCDRPADSWVTCSEWRLRVNFKAGVGRQDIDIPSGAGCGGYRNGVPAGEDDCTTHLELADAASEVRLNDSTFRSVPLQVSRDGHRVAYFSKQSLRFVAWDLPSARRVPISPRLDTRTMAHSGSLTISPDGAFFATSFSGDRPHLLITEFATGKTTTIDGYCSIIGLSKDASRIAAQRKCDGLETDETVILLGRDGTVLGEWSGVQDSARLSLSPDGKTVLELLSTGMESTDEYAITRDAVTGRINRRLRLDLLSEPSDAIGHDWLTDDEYIVEAEAPEGGGSFGFYRLNVTSGKSSRIRDLGLNPGEALAIGTATVKYQ